MVESHEQGSWGPRMSMSLHQSPRLLQMLDMECTCCRMSRNRHQLGSTPDQDRLETVLFGAKKYAVCVGCWLPVGDKLVKDKNYRQRWTRRARRLIAS